MTLPQKPRAVVTGAAGGLGRALSLALASRQASLVISDVDMTGAEETVRLVVQAGGKARSAHCDVSKPEQVEDLARFAESELGGVDLLVNNAGVSVSGAVGEVPLADWAWIFGINLWGPIYGCHTFAPRFKKQGSGHILNVASAAGLTSAPEMAAYNVTKAGVISLSETLYNELAPFGVGVTVLCPTFFQTGIMANSRTKNRDNELVETAERLMRSSKLQAPEVAARALAACDRGELFCVPMTDGKLSWVLKRLAPETFYKRLLPTVWSRVRTRPTKP